MLAKSRARLPGGFVDVDGEIFVLPRGALRLFEHAPQRFAPGSLRPTRNDSTSAITAEEAIYTRLQVLASLRARSDEAISGEHRSQSSAEIMMTRIARSRCESKFTSSGSSLLTQA